MLSISEDFEALLVNLCSTKCFLYPYQNFCNIAILLPCQALSKTIEFHKRKQKKQDNGKHMAREVVMKW